MHYRFHNWLRDARDWAVSRNRYWGTPIPLWTSEDFTEVRESTSLERIEMFHCGFECITLDVRYKDIHYKLHCLLLETLRSPCLA